MHFNIQTIRFFMAVFYSLDQKWKQQFPVIVSHAEEVNLHKALYQAMKEDLLGDFGRQLYFDPLYGMLHGLEAILIQAAYNHLIRLDGSDFKYYLRGLDPREIVDLGLRIGASPKQVERVARRLSELLDEQEQTITLKKRLAHAI